MAYGHVHAQQVQSDVYEAVGRVLGDDGIAEAEAGGPDLRGTRAVADDPRGGVWCRAPHVR